MKRINKTYKLAFALAMASTIPVLGYVMHASSGENRRTLENRILSCEQFSLICTLCLQRNDSAILTKFSSDLLERDKSLAGIRITRIDGKKVCDLGDSATQNFEDSTKAQDDRRIRATLYRMQQPWGTVDFYYHQPSNQASNPQLFLVSSLAVLCNLIIFSVLLRRSLAVLDTSKVVPTRVKNTLNTIPDGVVIIDAEGRVIVVNEAFQKSTGMTADELIGSGLEKIPFVPLESILPWTNPEKSSKTKNGVKAYLQRPDGDRFFTVGCSPIFDAEENHAGNLVSFQDITLLENQKRKIEFTLKELGESKEQLRQQNEKLHELASKDMLTGVFNRRFLFEHMEHHWSTSLQQRLSLSVVMFDVDHFKKLNDGYGHAVGDQVLRDVSAVIRGSVPDNAIVGRYGGEEFCVILPNLDASLATQAAEKIRCAIQTKLEQPYHVTASIGVASNLSDVTSYQMMIDRADKALYAAKHSGRNAVKCWSVEVEKPIPGAPVQKPSTRASSRSSTQPTPALNPFKEIAPEKEIATMVQELTEISSLPAKPRIEKPSDVGSV
ncbi:MAG: diguanylate cyclase [Planctomycetota bacterium]